MISFDPAAVRIVRACRPSGRRLEIGQGGIFDLAVGLE
jgi:hypothetical protein